MIRRPPRSTLSSSSAASDVYKRQSLRGAVAYALFTRADIAVYVVALQRAQAETAKFMHVKALNAIVHRLHNISHKLVYQPFNRSPNGGGTTVNTVFVIHCDSAFKKEDDTGHALKGIIILRCEAFSAGPLRPGSRICHVIDFVSKRLRHVTRSIFSSECFAVCDGAA